MFKGTVVVDFPDHWVEGTKFGNHKRYPNRQVIQFGNGRTFMFWFDGELNEPMYKELNDDAKHEIEFGSPKFIEPRHVVRMFGQSSKRINLYGYDK